MNQTTEFDLISGSAKLSKYRDKMMETVTDYQTRIVFTFYSHGTLLRLTRHSSCQTKSDFISSKDDATRL